MLNCYFFYPLTLNVLIEHSTFSANEILGMFLFDNVAFDSKIVFNNVTVFNNHKGGLFQLEVPLCWILCHHILLRITMEH